MNSSSNKETYEVPRLLATVADLFLLRLVAVARNVAKVLKALRTGKRSANDTVSPREHLHHSYSTSDQMNLQGIYDSVVFSSIHVRIQLIVKCDLLAAKVTNATAVVARLSATVAVTTTTKAITTVRAVTRNVTRLATLHNGRIKIMAQ